MKALFDKETHYYKYVDTEWTQPTLTGDNVYVNNFLVTGSYAAYYPNTGYAGVYVDEGQGWITLYMQFNKPFVAKKFTFHTQTGWDAASGAYAISFQGSNDGSNWTTIGTSPDTPEGQTATIDMSSNNTPHQFYRLSVRNGGWAYEDALNIDNLHLYGNIREIAEESADDYDYKIEVGKTYIVKEENVRKYYKYDWEAAFSPIFYSQAEATDGIDGVKIISNAGYYYLTQPSTHTISRGNTVTFDMGETSKGINSIGFTGIVVGGSYPSLVMSNVQCSEDNSTWTTITSSYGGRGTVYTNPLAITTPNNYRYIRFTASNDDGGFSQGGCQSLTVGYNKRIVIDGTPDDYDFYKDVDVYKAIKSYTKGQYYGN